MKILLDECAPRKLKLFLENHGHLCSTVQEQGWSGIRNGELLALAELSFDVLISVDRNIRYQQNLAGRNLGLVVIRARTNRLIDLEPHFPACAEALIDIQSGQLIEISQK